MRSGTRSIKHSETLYFAQTKCARVTRSGLEHSRSVLEVGAPPRLWWPVAPRVGWRARRAAPRSRRARSPAALADVAAGWLSDAARSTTFRDALAPLLAPMRELVDAKPCALERARARVRRGTLSAQDGRAGAVRCAQGAATARASLRSCARYSRGCSRAACTGARAPRSCAGASSPRARRARPRSSARGASSTRRPQRSATRTRSTRRRRRARRRQR